MPGWGNVFGKIFDWIPGREESIRNKIQKLERERDEIIDAGIPDNRYARLQSVLEQLRNEEAKLKNR